MSKRAVFKNKALLLADRISSSDTVLDVGFLGQGIQQNDSRWPHALLQQQAANVYGVDLSIDRTLFPNTLRYHEQSAEDFSFPDVSFDAVFAGDLIEHLSNPGLFLAACRTHLQAQGKLILTTPNAFNLFNIAEKITKDEPTVNADHTLYFNHKVLKKLLEKNGFVVDEIAYIYSLEYTHRESIKKKILNVLYRLISILTPKFTETLVVVAHPV